MSISIAPAHKMYLQKPFNKPKWWDKRGRVYNVEIWKSLSIYLFILTTKRFKFYPLPFLFLKRFKFYPLPFLFLDLITLGDLMTIFHKKFVS